MLNHQYKIIFYIFSSWISSFPDSAVIRVHTLPVHLTCQRMQFKMVCGILKAWRLRSVWTQILLSSLVAKWKDARAPIFCNPQHAFLFLVSSCRRNVLSKITFIKQYRWVCSNQSYSICQFSVFTRLYEKHM